MQPPAVKIVLQKILSSKNPSSEFPQPVLQVTNASLVYSDTNHQLKDYATTPTPTQHEPGEAKARSAAKLRLSDTAYWAHALLQDKNLHDLVSSNKLCKGYVVRLTNYEVIKQMRRPKAEDEDRGDEVWSSPPSKRRCRSPVGNGFNVVKPTFGGREAELPCLLIRGLEILSSGKRKKERENVEDEEVKKEMMKSEAKLPVVPPPAMVLKPSSQRPVSNVLSLSRFLSQKKTSNSKDSDLTSSSAIDHGPTISGIPRNNPISWTDRRMALGQLETATHGKRASFFAVLLCRRHPYDKKSLEGAKQDWYLWDPTSKVIPPSTTTSPPLPSRRRKTILSVWRDHSKFQPTPGTILALRNLTIDKHWNDTIADQNWKEILDDKHWDERIGPPVKMVKVNRSMGHGNINAFATTPAEWFLLDASGVEGYRAVKEWWEGVGRREWEAEVRIDERLKKDIGVRREIMRREREAVLAKQRIGGGAGGGGEGLKRKREPEEEDYVGMDDLETERLMLEELKRDRNFGNG
ncbi:hypothetical protein B9Z19DRAFT_1084586 [Tuber borchii]|uniref:Uncharacterized protein n=1 Tax=Tuber borchii TaxID=42251 RepID=A0A2T6ZRV4_TUBBO|nr:hypothetical protein B9Z19DRAFT_1084586 [Tuber borchii]